MTPLAECSHQIEWRNSPTSHNKRPVLFECAMKMIECGYKRVMAFLRKWPSYLERIVILVFIGTHLQRLNETLWPEGADVAQAILPARHATGANSQLPTRDKALTLPKAQTLTTGKVASGRERSMNVRRKSAVSSSAPYKARKMTRRLQ